MPIRSGRRNTSHRLPRQPDTTNALPIHYASFELPFLPCFLTIGSCARYLLPRLFELVPPGTTSFGKFHHKSFSKPKWKLYLATGGLRTTVYA